VGGGPQVNVYDTLTGTLERSFFAFDFRFRGGVNVAIGDVNNDGVTDYVAGMKSDGSLVNVLDGATGSLDAVAPVPFDGFTGGVSVALRDVNRDSIPDLSVGAGRGGGPRVYTRLSDNVYYPPSSFPADFFAFDSAFTGGVNVG
jgi:hypothetical protein